MPELPEVETTKRGLEPHIVGKTGFICPNPSKTTSLGNPFSPPHNHKGRVH